MLFIHNDVVQRVLTIEDAIRTQEEAFLGLISRDSVHRTRIDIYVPAEREDGYFRWGTMEGASKTLGVHAIRMKSDIVYWPKDEQGNWTEEKYCVEPGTYCGLIFLVSTRNGEPLAMINDGYLQHMRVGAGAGIGVKYLARENASVVGLLGSGGMARTYLKAFCAVRPIEKVRVFSPTKANREAYAAEMSEELGVQIEPVGSAEEAVRGSDIVSCCTDAMQHVIDGSWLEPGMHVTNLGNFELDPKTFERANVIVKQGLPGVIPNDPNQRVEIGRGHSPVAYIAGTDEEVARLPASSADSNRVFAEERYPYFVDLASGAAPGRTSDDDITIYLNVGYQGLQFAAVGAAVYNAAKAQGLGRELPTEWFLQDIRD
jgi:alanine dehydrogenase